ENGGINRRPRSADRLVDDEVLGVGRIGCDTARPRRPGEADIAQTHADFRRFARFGLQIRICDGGVPEGEVLESLVHLAWCWRLEAVRVIGVGAEPVRWP